MSYLAKQTILDAYKLLSNIDSDKQQGLTQKVSALKYGSALDLFYKINNDNCDLKDTGNKNKFTACVGNIIKIDDDYCTKNFYKNISPNGRDFDCGSNFYSQSSVKDSSTNPNQVFLYPKRSGWKPVMDVKDQVLIYRPDYYREAFFSYLPTSELRLAFILWLLRNEVFDAEGLEGIQNALTRMFSKEFCDALFTEDVMSEDISWIKFDSEQAVIKKEDIDMLYCNENECHCSEQLYRYQCIFFGTPGSGKSKTIKDAVKDIYPTEEDRNAYVFRTTFHPDSDYSSFVGTYKPFSTNFSQILNDYELCWELAKILDSKVTYPCQKFAAKYWKSLKELKPGIRVSILKECKQPSSMDTEFSKGIAIGETYLNEDKISYKFIPQTFTNAYVKAWKSPEKPVFLIIEEINRGNCAQIFGDLFQLLDRKDGVSEYPINADEDLRQYLEEKLGADNDGIKGGKLKLPANLHILATMNTSDQSLFPMDSAFKRRWTWEYVPIRYDDNVESAAYTIEIKDKKYFWHHFLRAVNKRIQEVTHSEDKQMGNFFITGSVNQRQFVDKVMFYLWNDVCKEEYKTSNNFFRIDENNEFSFGDLFLDDSTEKLTGFMKYLGVKPIGEDTENETPTSNE